MIDIYVNHDAGFEISNLVKAFFFLKKINLVEREELLNKTDINNIKVINVWKENKAISKVVYGDKIVEKTLDISDVDILEDSEVKRKRICLRRNLYEALTEFTGRKIEWGILTGIRPVKIIHSLFEKGFSDSEIRKVLSEQYKISDKKIELIESIGKIEREIIYPLDSNKYSLYIGIPFCPTRCSYCSFTSNRYDDKKADKYIEYLKYEIEKNSEMLRGKDLDTVYIGGGTPTSLNLSQMESILVHLKKFFPGDYREFTVEAGRPDTIDREKLELLKKYGVGRISINPQTMNDSTLKKIDRDHSSEDIVEKYNLAKKIGFDSINMDLIIGLPDEGPEEARITMEAISKLKPDNLTIHTMALKRDSKISKNIDKYHLSETEKIEEMLDIASKAAGHMNLEPYYMYRQKQILGNFENIGYSLKGKECIYNIMMMEEKQTIIALGVGSVSKIFFPEEDRIERVANFKDLNVYFDRIDDMIEKKKNLI